MHNPSPQTLVTALERLAGADGAVDVAQAVGDWLDLGLVGAVAIWLCDEDRLQLLHTRGIPRALEDWRPGPRSPESVLWAAITRAEPVSLDLAQVPLGLAAPLKSTAMDSWTAIPLRGRGGERVGVVVVGVQSWHPGGAPWDVVGLALQRALRFDHANWRAKWFDAIIPLVSDGIIIADLRGAYYTYSPPLERLVGWTEAQVRDAGWTSLVYPDPTTQAAMHRAIAALTLGAASEGTVRTLATSDGTQVHAEIRSTLVEHPHRKAPALIGVFRDVTVDKNTALKATRDDALTRLGRMAGGVAHEFNNLLGAIMGHAELIEQGADVDSGVQQRAARVVTAAKRGADLSKQLLAFSGATVSRIGPAATPPLIEELVELFRPALPRHLDLHLSIDAALGPIETDPTQLQQALTNLLANARDAAKHVITVSVKASPLPPSVTFRAVEAPETGTLMCRIRIHDDGPGFSDEAMANLFEPFWTGKADGHGLGLAAVRGIVGLQSGALDIRRAEGSQVDVYLPLSLRPELSLARLAGAPPLGRGTVWLIDDERSVLEFSLISLQAAGYDVRSFHDGSSVLDAARNMTKAEHPELLVVDVVMPGMSGPELVAQLRASGFESDLLWTSGYSPARAGVPSEGAFLQKPFTGTELAAALRKLLPVGVE